MNDIHTCKTILKEKGLNELSASELEDICNKKVREFGHPLVVWYILEDIFHGIGDLSRKNQLYQERGWDIFTPLMTPINKIFDMILLGDNDSNLFLQLGLLIEKYVIIESELPR